MLRDCPSNIERVVKMEKKSNLKKIVISIAGVLVLAVLCVLMLFLWNKNKDKPQEGLKNIVVQVQSDRDSYSFEQAYQTDEEFLGNFLASENLIGFNESEFGRYITSVQGYEAKDEEQSWWCIMVNGESAVTGVDEIAVEDGSTYLLELKIGW